MQNEILIECMKMHATLLQAIRAWFHGAHHVTDGIGFHGDHSFYEEVYKSFSDYYDTTVEKSIGIAGCECVASPQQILFGACKILSAYPDPVGMSSLSIAAAGNSILNEYLDFLSEITKDLEQHGSLTLGLDDFHAATANAVETFVYKLGQRIKSEISSAS